MAIIEAIATTYLEADAASVTFSSIPATYEHLQLRASIRSTDSGASLSGYNGGLKCRINGQTAGYWTKTMQGGDYNGAGSVSAGTWAGGTDDYMTLGYAPTADVDGAVYGSVIFNLFDYANTNKNSTFQNYSGYGLGDPSGEGMSANFISNLLASYTSAIDTILLYGNNNFVRGSEFSLYGIQE